MFLQTIYLTFFNILFCFLFFLCYSNIQVTFQVAIVAASSCRYLYWQRSCLEYLFVKDTYIATVLTTLIARDITTKLYAMNNKIVTAKGSHLDIRLPSITSSLTSGGEYKSPIRTKKVNGGKCYFYHRNINTELTYINCLKSRVYSLSKNKKLFKQILLALLLILGIH